MLSDATHKDRKCTFIIKVHLKLLDLTERQTDRRDSTIPECAFFFGQLDSTNIFMREELIKCICICFLIVGPFK